jgi:hypothetical protein
MGLVITTILTAYISTPSLSDQVFGQPHPFSGLIIHGPRFVNVHGTIFIDEQGRVETHIGTASEGQQESHPGLGCSLRC